MVSSSARTWRARRLSAAALLGVGACAFEWDGYDPRLRPGGPEGCSPGETTPCYTGPEATEDVGVCRAGVATCRDDGTFGGCEGEVLPATERCETPADDDCDGTATDRDEGCVCLAGEVSPCYDGPDGTDGVGMCSAGEAQCNAEGTAFTAACVGQVFPVTVEECASSVDDDCDGAANDWCAGWVKRYGGDGDQIPRALALTSSAVFVAGDLRSCADFGGGDLCSNGGSDAFVAKLAAADGAHSWSRRFGDSGSDQFVRAAATDATGDVYLAGRFAGTIDFGGAAGSFTALGGEDAFAVKLAGANGDAIWAWHGEGNGYECGYAITVNADGEVVVAGEVTGDIELGSAAMPVVSTTSDGMSDGFITKLDADGAAIWGFTYGSDGIDWSGDAVFDSAGDVVLAGVFTTELDFGGAPVDGVGLLTGFTAKLDAAGDEVWVHPLGGNGSVYAEKLAIGADDRVFVEGLFDVDVDLGEGTVTASAQPDGFVLALDEDGGYTWSTVLAGQGVIDSQAFDVASDGTIAAGFDLQGDAQIGSLPVLGAGADDWLLVLLDAAGATQVVRRYGDTSQDELAGVRFLGDDLIAVGECQGSTDFGLGPTEYLDDEKYGADVCVVRMAQ